MSNRPKEFTDCHDNIIHLYCKVEPDDIELSDIFNSVHLYSGGLAFSNPKVRRFSSNRRQTIKRRLNPPPRVFVAAEFYPFFEPNNIIDTLLSSQSPPRTRTTMSRSIRSRGKTVRDDESIVDDDDFMAEDEMLAASLRNLNVGGASRTRSNQ